MQRECPTCGNELTDSNAQNGTSVGETAILKCTCGATTSWFEGVQFKTFLPDGERITHNGDAISRHF